MNKFPLVLALTGLTLLVACNKKEAEKPAEKLTNITVAKVEKRDLPVIESAVGNATSLGVAQALDSSTQTLEVIAELPGGREWYSLGSVRGEVTVGVHRGALVVPEQAVVLRPAGAVVYVLDGETVKERPVTIGLSRDGVIEISAGVQAGETVAVDGASLLSDGARIRIMEPTPPAAVKTAP